MEIGNTNIQRFCNPFSQQPTEGCKNSLFFLLYCLRTVALLIMIKTLLSTWNLPEMILNQSLLKRLPWQWHLLQSGTPENERKKDYNNLEKYKAAGRQRENLGDKLLATLLWFGLKSTIYKIIIAENSYSSKLGKGIAKYYKYGGPITMSIVWLLYVTFFVSWFTEKPCGKTKCKFFFG